MDDIQERRRKRLVFLNKLYEKTGGDEIKPVVIDDFRRQLGFTEEESAITTQYLKGEGLIASTGAVSIGITHYGVQQVEEALEHPDKPTKYFPPVNIIHIENMNHSQVQQGNLSSTQTVTFNIDNTEDFKAFVQQFKAQLEQIPFSPEDKLEASSELATIHAQIQSPRPKHVVITGSLKTLRNLLEGVAGNVIAAGLLQHFPHLIR